MQQLVQPLPVANDHHRLSGQGPLQGQVTPRELFLYRLQHLGGQAAQVKLPFLVGERANIGQRQLIQIVHQVGEMEDLHRITRDDLYNHYRTHYVPSNAVLAIAGDFDIPDMLARVKERYLGIPDGAAPPQPVHKPEKLSGEKRIEVKGPGETTYLKLAYHAPVADSRDFFALTVVDSLLSGPSSLNMFGGGGISNKTSRLYRALVENELAVSVYGSLQATIDPYLYAITATVHPGKKPDAVLTALDEQIHRLQDKPVPEEEIRRAVKQARALFAYGSENITNQAFWLGYAEMFSTYDWFIGYVQALETITPQEVQEAARRYLQDSSRIVGILVPENSAEGDA